MYFSLVSMCVPLVIKTKGLNQFYIPAVQLHFAECTFPMSLDINTETLSSGISFILLLGNDEMTLILTKQCELFFTNWVVNEIINMTILKENTAGFLGH